MSTAVMPESRSVTALAKIEALRLAKHPVFAVGAVAAFGFTIAASRDVDYYNIAIVPAFFIGLFGMVALFRLTRSMEKLEEAVGTTPTGIQDRVRALCLATALPGLLGLVAFAIILGRNSSAPDWALGYWTSTDRVAIFVGSIVVACVGGPLLGIAAARWLRFPGAVVVPVLVLLFWILTGEGLSDTHPQAWWGELVRLAAPWAQFSSVSSNEKLFGSWTGSPYWWTAWAVVLCVLAVLAALMKGAEPAERKRLFRTGAGVGALGLVFLALAMTTGHQTAQISTPSGVQPYVKGLESSK
jgi:hypothetical protein